MLRNMGRYLIYGFLIAAALVLITTMANATTSSGPFAYIANFGDGTLSVINTQTNTVTTTIPLAVGGPVAVNPAGTLVYVANGGPSGSDNLSVLNATTNTVTATIVLDGNPAGVAVSPDGSKVYVSNGNNVSVIDTATNLVTANIPMGIGPGDLVVSPDGSKIYVTDYNSTSDQLTMNPIYNGTVEVIDAATNTVTSIITVGKWPMGIAISPDGTKVYSTNYEDGTISVIDTATNTVTATMQNPYGSWAIAVNPTGTRVYATSDYNISVIDAATNTIIANVYDQSLPQGLAVTPDGSKIYATNWENNTVTVIDAATNTVTATITVGNFPRTSGQFIVPAPAMSKSVSTPTSSAASTAKPSPFIGAGAIGAIIIGAMLFMLVKRKRD